MKRAPTDEVGGSGITHWPLWYSGLLYYDVACVSCLYSAIRRIVYLGLSVLPTVQVAIALSRHCPSLSALRLNASRALTDAGLAALLAGCPALSSLTLHRCVRLTNACVRHLAAAPSLVDFDLAYCNDELLTIDAFRAVAPQLRWHQVRTALEVPVLCGREQRMQTATCRGWRDALWQEIALGSCCARWSAGER